ncbi:MAG: hypothetical protein PVJ57_10885 [Phycisphaerae bacterium]|jgi:hypothetical protein
MTRKTAATIVAVLLGVLLGAGLGCDERGNPPGSHAPLPPGQPMRYRGLAIQVQSGYEPLDQYAPLFHEAAEMGANTVLLITPAFMEHAEAQTIFIEARKTPSPPEFKQLIQAAREEGLEVILMPIVLLAKPRGSEWRGVIDPPDWDDWWRQYRELIVYFCEIAREGGATGLMVGSELVSTEKYTDEWYKVIELARTNFYGGVLGYSANWDHYRPVKFWDKLDLIGMTSYYTLSDKANPTVEQIVARWQPIHDDITRWQRQIGKPLLFTEVGWCSQEGASTAPWNYYHYQKATPAGHEEQRRLYEAFLRVWNDTPGMAGIIWWDWSHAPGGAGDYGYTPRGKPAERVLRDWFASFAPQSAPATQPSSDSAPATAP